MLPMLVMFHDNVMKTNLAKYEERGRGKGGQIFQIDTRPFDMMPNSKAEVIGTQ
jgi:hypothetical protein